MIIYNGENSEEIANFVKKANLPMSYISQGLGSDKTLFIETMQGTLIVRKGDGVSSFGRKIRVF